MDRHFHFTRPMIGIARTLYRRCHRLTIDTANRLGIAVSPARDYYSPLPVRQELLATRERWDRPSHLVGVAVDLDEMERLLLEIVGRFGPEWEALPPYDEAKTLGYGPGFTRADAEVLYLMLRHLRPRRFLEVGSGLSTWYAAQAAAANVADGAPCEIQCIDPWVRERVAALPGVEVERRQVQDTDLARFEALETGDVLFIDSTHVVRIDGDVPFLYLEAIPRVAPGVVVHAHDIPFPYHVPHPAEEYIASAKWPKYWTEAMLLQAFLAFNCEFKIDLSVPLLRHHRETVLLDGLSGYRPITPADYDTHAGSIWFRRHSV